MSEHAKEPWRAFKGRFRDCTDEHIATINIFDANGKYVYGADDYSDEQEANFRQIVACVNACADVSTETLERMGETIISQDYK